MTYNTFRRTDGVIPIALPPPAAVRRARSYRAAPWATSHLRTFRKELFKHVPESAMIDPETGHYWANADDVALTFALLELSGSHARHLFRICCIYDLSERSEETIDRPGQLARVGRIRRMPRERPLESLLDLAPDAPRARSSHQCRTGAR